MRTVLFVTIGIALTCLTACSKGDSGSSGLTGAWLEMSATGGFTGGTTVFNDHRRILRLNTNGTWSFRLSDTLTVSGVYSLSTIMNGSQPATLISYKTSTGSYWSSQIIMEIKNGQLVLTDNHPDGYTSIYIRWLF